MQSPTEQILASARSGSTASKGKLFKRLLMPYSGETGALEDIDEITGACHKRFKTRAQAEAFIEDWKESFADVWRQEVRRALDRGHWWSVDIGGP